MRPLRFFRREPLGAIGGVVILALVLTAAFADSLATHDPIRTDPEHTLARPTRSHWLGTDNLGRDIYSRIIYGARVSLLVGLGATMLGMTIGAAIGLISGYLGGWIDLTAQRVMEILQGLPLLILALVMAAALRPSIANVIVAISVPIIPMAERVIRSSVLAIREFAYI